MCARVFLILGGGVGMKKKPFNFHIDNAASCVTSSLGDKLGTLGNKGIDCVQRSDPHLNTVSENRMHSEHLYNRFLISLCPSKLSLTLGEGPLFFCSFT